MSHEDFDIDRLAAYLHLTLQQVTRLAERGKIPGRKVSGQWRFSQADIHHWLEERMGLLDPEELVQMESALEQSAPPGSAEEISIFEMLPLAAIEIPLPARTRSSVFTSMVKVAARSGSLWDPDKMAEAIRTREEMHPTALDNGVALLHPRRPMSGILDQPFLALGVVPGGIPFGGSAGVLTDVFFLVCSVDDRGHLRTLARLSRVISSHGFLDALRHAPDARAARELIGRTEAALS